ncbi:carboxy-cis,cis-muconate cyclase [Bifidobacterium myosotis]|uniref:Carboxy-cis,cis-muconate cyclase n=1 Tax=Bifidobacterium myosotis TaxID=1630166 RepID=A0A261FMS9_9BIFI|nr:beta-propeller fold lactonase family protein [Bifidobacterium myosotis]OZG60418.1 carboxy-cis,cis-muconate cyclase [Bifidobacterium myosotis]
MTHDVDAYDSNMVLAVGGFGARRGSSCPGIEAVTLHTADATADNDGFPVNISLHKDGVLASVPSPTWIARDGDLLYAVLEDTNEVAAFRINRNSAETANTAIEDSETGPSETSEVATNNTALSNTTVSNIATGDSRTGDVETSEVATNNIAVNTTAINNTAAVPTLTELSRVPASGVSPTHAVVVTDDIGGKHLIVANYADGHVCVHPIAADGTLLEATQVLAGEGHGPLPAQEGPHAHWILPLPDGRVLSTDLGADRIYVHHWRSGELVRVGMVQLAAGTGPRDLHLLPVTDKDATTSGADWRVAVVGEWADTVTLLGPVPGISNKADGQNDDPAQSIDSDGIRVLQTVSLGGDALDQAASLAFVPWAILRMGIRQTTDNNGSSAGEAYRNPGNRNDDGTRDADAHGTSIGYSITSGSPISESPATIPVDESSVAGVAYVGLRGSERIVALAWDGERLSRLAPEHEPGWRGRGIDCGGSRPRHIMRVGNVLLVANEVSNNLTVFQLGPDGKPVRVTDLASGSPTVFVRL